MPQMNAKSNPAGEFKAQQLPFNTQDPRLMKKPTQPMHNKPMQQQNNTKDPSEFQALWNGMLQVN